MTTVLPEDATIAAMIKVGGALGGAILALVFLPPKTTKEFWQRLLFSGIAGTLLSDITREFLRMPDTMSMWMASATLTALASWWMWGAAVRILSKWKPK